ncbi:MAG: TM0106 family RecB-like putative nuclease [Planctomycetes bacterium]|nr:TM0106 family RecB-like putative nuclease [Planctomycetota bacterium]
MNNHVITKEILDGFLHCHRKGLLRDGNVDTNQNAYLNLLKTSMASFQAGAKQLLTNQVEDGDVSIGPSTSSSLSTGRRLILDVRLTAGNYSTIVDALERCPGDSHLGQFHYRPIRLVHGDRVDRADKVLLAFDGLVVGHVQGLWPTYGRIVYGSKLRVSRVRLDSYYQDLSSSLTQFEESTADSLKAPPPLNAHCDVCEFRKVCRVAASEADHLCLLRGMTAKEIQRHNSKGIFTVNQLSYTFRSRRPRKRSKNTSRPRSFALQAMALREQRVFIHGDVSLPDAAVRVYLDIEGNSDRKAVYLVGAIIEHDQTTEYIPFWADDSASEVRLVESFLERISCFDDIHVYYYGSYDSAVLRRLAGCLSHCYQDRMTVLLKRATNVLSIVHQHVYFPVYSNSLKEIAATLGFTWTDSTADGKSSVIWRRNWQRTRDQTLKERLIAYNRDDCRALRCVTEFIRQAVEACTDENEETNGPLVAQNTRALGSSTSHRPRFGRFESIVDELNEINCCAYFHYQRDKVRVGTGKSRNGRSRERQRKLGQRPNKTVELYARRCLNCRSTKIRRRSQLTRKILDLRFGNGYVKKWITAFVFHRYYCKSCSTTFVPDGAPDNATKYGHGLASWCVYNHVAGGQNMLRIQRGLRDVFRMNVPQPAIYRFKKTIRNLIEPDLKRILSDLRSGTVLYIDETEVKLRGSKGYVWVFASAENVYYEYRESRSADFLHEFIGSFDGVIVSDFFTGYDSLPVPQQKCLIHLIREMNDDLLKFPYDDEFRSVVDSFAKMFRSVTQTIDRFGLKRRHLQKHKRELLGLFDTISTNTYSSVAAQKHQARILKYGQRMLTFMDFDGVCWNNNFAENAVKRFARFRRFADGRFTETSLRELLAIMSVFQSLDRQGNDVLQFLHGLVPSSKADRADVARSTGYGSRRDEEETVNRMVRMRRKSATRNGMTYEEIAALLNSECVPTRRGGRWWGTTVRNAIRRARRRPSGG